VNIQEALNVLGLSGELTESDIKKAYKRLAVKFRPLAECFDILTDKFLSTLK
jgi:preprotein translocase subunit Sec63